MSPCSAAGFLALGLLLAPGLAASTTSLGPYQVTTDEVGGFQVTLGERVLLESAGPMTERRFRAYGAQLFGATRFLKQEREDLAWDRFLGLEASEEALVLRFGTARRPEAVAELRLLVRQGRLRLEVRRRGVDGQGLRIPFVKPPEARFLGFGEQFDRVDQTGHRVPLWVNEQGIGREAVDGRPHSPTHPAWAEPLLSAEQALVRSLSLPWKGREFDTYYPVASFVDPARGLGVVVESTRKVIVDCGEADPSRWTVEAWEPERLAVEVAPGPEPLQVISQLTAAMGRPSTPPPWAFGTWLAVEGGEERVRAAHARAREFGVSLDALWVQDWVGRRPRPIIQNLRYEWKVDRKTYPEIEQLITDLHGDGVRFLGYINPFLSPGSGMYRQARRAGHLVRNALGATFRAWHSTFWVSHMDFTSPTAREYFQDHVARMLDLGMDGFMADYGEWLPWSGRLADGAPPAEHNHYPGRYHEATRAALDAGRPGGDYVMFTRSGWTGAQRHQQIVWAGDQECHWDDRDGLASLPRAGISAGLSGIPFWTHDIGGYSGGPRTKELFLRWAELGAFTPVMRTHEGLLPGRNWQWDSDDETTTRFARLTQVHEVVAQRVLRPLARRVADTGRPLIRHLALHFPEDPVVYQVEDQYMLGPDLLVAPVLEPGATTRGVYLPEGTWYLVWNGEAYQGPGSVVVPAHLGEPPAFATAPPQQVLGPEWADFMR
jgi:alpha-glucosidase